MYNVHTYREKFIYWRRVGDILTLSSAISAVQWCQWSQITICCPKIAEFWRFFTHHVFTVFTLVFTSFHEIFLKTEYFLLTWRNDAFAIFWRVSVRALDKNEESYFFIGLKMNKLAIKLVYKSYQNLLNVYHLYSSEIFVKLTNHAVFFLFL